MPATAAATPFAAPTRSHGRRGNDVAAGSATTGELGARRANRALLRSALLLFTLMTIPLPDMLVDKATRTCSCRKAVRRCWLLVLYVFVATALDVCWSRTSHPAKL